MIIGITMQQPNGVASPSHDTPRDGNESKSHESNKSVINTGEPYVHDSSQTYHMHPPLNRETSQQQVYVNRPGAPPGASDMTGLENQFQSLGFKQEDSIGTDQLSSSAPNSESNNHDETENDGEESDEDPPLKLFVGQVSSVIYTCTMSLLEIFFALFCMLRASSLLTLFIFV